MTNRTPGPPPPWDYTPAKTETATVQIDGRDVLAEVYVSEVTDGTNRLRARVQGILSRECTEEIARLMAAAPDLFIACRSLVSWNDMDLSSGYLEDALNRARAAIAKATGDPTPPPPRTASPPAPR